MAATITTKIESAYENGLPKSNLEASLYVRGISKNGESVNINTDDFLNQKSIGIISKTYAELKTMRNSETLQEGQFYRISDFQSIYTQSETGLTMGRTGDECVSNIEPLIILATSKNTFDVKAFSSLAPKDEIWYNFDNVGVYANANGKGFIYRRIDERQNDIPFDFKNLRFRRWFIDYNAIEIWSPTKTYGMLTAVRNAGAPDGNVYFAKTDVPMNQNPTSTEYSYWGIATRKANTVAQFHTTNRGFNFGDDLNVFVATSSDYRDFFLFDTGEEIENSTSEKIYNNTISRCFNSVFIGVQTNIFNNNVSLHSDTIIYNFHGVEGEFSANLFSGYVYNLKTIGALHGNSAAYQIGDSIFKETFEFPFIYTPIIGRTVQYENADYSIVSTHIFQGIIQIERLSLWPL